MILPDFLIRKWALAGGVIPFDSNCVNPASLDLKLSNEFVFLTDPQSWPSGKFKANSLELWPGDALLASTLEWITMPPDCGGVMYLKSSLARSGLDHALAGWVDPGFCGNLTFELHAHRSVPLHCEQRIAQLVLYKCLYEPESLYDGKYQGQKGTTETIP